MQTIYTATVELAHTSYHGGEKLALRTVDNRNFNFRTMEERNDFVQAMRDSGFKCRTSIDHIMTVEEARDDAQAAHKRLEELSI